MHHLPDQKQFVRTYDTGAPQLVWSAFLTDLETPVSAMLKLMPASPYHLLFESVEGGETRARYSIIALNPDILWRCTEAGAELSRSGKPEDFTPDGSDAFASLRRLLAETALAIPPELPPMAAGLFGYMGYDMVKRMERLSDKNPETIGIPQAMYMRPRITVIFDSVKDEATIITPVYPNPGVDAAAAYKSACGRIEEVAERLNANLERSIFSRYYAGGMDTRAEVASHTTREDYHAMVRKAKEYIAAGDIFQVVPSRRFTRPFAHPPMAFYRALRHLNPSPYLFMMGMGGFTIVGSSPEILVRLREGVVTIRPIAGTRKRGVNPAEDKALEAELLADQKELAEHLMLLDLGRNDVGRVAKTGTVRVTERMVIERYSHVMHIVSNVEGELRPDKDCFDALIAGFPAGTVSGAPKIRAMEIIDELEKEKRSFYGGTVGYISANGSMDTCIALRTGLIKDGTLYLQAGGGVVADSDPEAEYQETQNKANALIAAANDAGRFV